jgi:Ca2+-binding RTX toxin-like protein
MVMNIIKGTNNDDTLTGTGASDRINGLAGNDFLYGDVGDDYLDGGVGDDYLNGSLGNDTYFFGIGSGQDSVSEYDATPGNLDTIQLGNGIAPTDVTISRGISDLTIKINGTTDQLTLPYWFASDADKIEQVKFADSTLWDVAALLANLTDRAATDGNDYLTGDSGANTLSGLKGNDTYVVDHAGDEVKEKLNEGTDTVEAKITYKLAANIENLTLTGNAAINGSGNALNNRIKGNSADNILNGGVGDDFLDGGSGNDTYMFGIGSGHDSVDDNDANSGNLDTIQLGNGIAATDVTIRRDIFNLTIKINETTDQLTLSDWFTSDADKIEQVKFADGTLWNVEALLANFADLATDGDDYLAGDSGANTLMGLKGNDIYNVDHVGDEVKEKLNEGVDTVEAKITYKLAANVENLTLIGNAAINGTGNALHNSIHGNIANNILSGGFGDDVLKGDSGNDILNGGAGDDWLYGGNIIFIGDIYDYYKGGEGNNLLHGSLNNDTLNGGAGNDKLYGSAGNDILNGGVGNDYLNDGSGNNILNGGVGDDQLRVYGYDILNSDYLNDGSGNNILNGGVGDDELYGGYGDDILDAGIGNDDLDGGSGNDILNGGAGDDGLNGGEWALAFDTYVTVDSGNDILNGGAGDDWLYGGSGKDILNGGVDDDRLNGGSGNDILNGGAGNDWLYGGDIISIGDYYKGGEGNDILNGGVGNDYLYGGSGNDILKGGAGDDIFLLTTFSTHTIKDFSIDNDTIQLDINVFTQLTTSGPLKAANFIEGAAAADTNDYVIYNKGTGELFYDADGSDPGAAEQIALLGTGTTHPALTFADFIVI